jgi:hypothetical protein
MICHPALASVYPKQEVLSLAVARILRARQDEQGIFDVARHKALEWGLF